MKLSRKQLRRMILSEINNVSEASDPTSAKGSHHIKQLLDYMAQQGMKYSPIGGMMVMAYYSDEINKILKKPENQGGGLKAASERFMDLLKNI